LLFGWEVGCRGSDDFGCVGGRIGAGILVGDLGVMLVECVDVEWARDVNISGVENYMLNEKVGMQNCAY